METLKIAKTRYATKIYDGSKSISEEQINELKEVLRLAPSSINIQPWQFTFVQNPELKVQLAEASLFNKDKINQANLLLVLSYADDLDAFQKVVDEDLDQNTREIYNNLKTQMSEEEIINWFIRQLYIALGVSLSTVAAMGLDSTPMEGIEPEKYKDILGMSGYKPMLAVAIGYHAEEDYNHPVKVPKSRRPFQDVIVSL